MHVKSVRLKSFRGFTDLTIEGLSASTRLVMLIGPNGTGKSSVFDAFMAWTGSQGAGWGGWDQSFYQKQVESEPKLNWPESISITLHETAPQTQDGWKSAAYFRSAYRNEPDFGQGDLGSVPQPLERRFHRSIENDAAVSTNYRRLILQTIRDVWSASASGTQTLQQYADAVRARVNASLARVIPHLRMESLGDPTAQTGNFYFGKGAAKEYLFKNLSGGEKAVFDMLIDLIAKMQYYSDSIVCIDEPESHVNPAIHGALLQELLDLVPATSQLWAATHAIGMLRRARDIEAAAPGTVAFVNFEADFDKPVVLQPAKMDRLMWQRALQVALHDLSALVSPKRMIICEGGPGARFVEDGLDGEIYNSIFGHVEPDTQFFSAGSHTDTERARDILSTLASSAIPGLEVVRLIDRDDRSEAEVAAERAKGVQVLSRRGAAGCCGSADRGARRRRCREGRKGWAGGRLQGRRRRNLSGVQGPAQIVEAGKHG